MHKLLWVFLLVPIVFCANTSATDSHQDIGNKDTNEFDMWRELNKGIGLHAS